MKAYLIIPALLLCLSSCQRPLPDAPPSNRPVVPPSGSSSTVKSWNQVTEQEANALLPFGTERR